MSTMKRYTLELNKAEANMLQFAIENNIRRMQANLAKGNIFVTERHIEEANELLEKIYKLSLQD